MEYLRRNLGNIKIYGFAMGLYCGVALLLILPAIDQHIVKAEVKDNLAITQNVVAKSNLSTAPVVIKGTPAILEIERLDINMPIKTGTYNQASQKWTLDNDHIFVNAINNQNPIISNTKAEQPNVAVFYGHNFSNVLGNTNKLVSGDILRITTTDSYEFTYYYVRDEIVSPDNSKILYAPNKTNPVALVTCTGAWNQVRRIMYFTMLGEPTKVPYKEQAARL